MSPSVGLTLVFLVVSAAAEPSPEIFKFTSKSCAAQNPELLEDNPQIEVTQGVLQGVKKNNINGLPFYAFLGIPYAKPPVEDRRFKDPEPAGNWEGVYDATKEGDVCLQLNRRSSQLYGKEDCLFINVYSTELPNESSQKRPVLVWIHGGGFVEGSGNANDYSPDFLLETGIVYVSINYRLGALGFLSTEDAAAPGNAGLKDQVLALRWVQNNIASLGGDPDRVTIFGESAGGASVHLLMLSPLSKGLFQAAIAHSGAALSPLAVAVNGRNRTLELAHTLGYSGGDSIEMVEFLRAVDAETFVVTSMNSSDNGGNLMINSPTLESPSEAAFLDTLPIQLLKQGRFHDVPFITGLTSGEGIVIVDPTGYLENPESVDKNFVEMFAPVLRGDELSNKTEQMKIVREFYFGSEPFSNLTTIDFVQMTTDLHFMNGLFSSVRIMILTAKSPVYVYQFSFDGVLGSIKNMSGAANIPGVAHGDDLAYLFLRPNIDPVVEVDSPDGQVRARTVNMWTNFVKTWNPTPETTPLVPIKWNPYKSDDPQVMDINSDMKVDKNFLHQRVAFWEALYSDYTERA